MFKKIPENVRRIMVSVAPLLIVAALSVIVGKFGFGKISDLRGQIALSRKDNTTLTQKLNLLTSISETAETGAIASVTALPSTNSALAVISQLKILSSQNGLIMTNMRGAGEAKDNSGLSRADVSFDVSGARVQVIAFLKGIAGIAPITLVDKIKMNEAGGVARASINVKSFWAPLPAKLPALAESIGDLTADEVKTLSDITALIQPAFVDIPPSEEGGGKVDPFAP